MLSKKHKKVCKTFNYTEHTLFFASTVMVYVSVSAFVSLVGIPLGITSSVVGLKIFVITARNKKYKSIIKKKKNT